MMDLICAFGTFDFDELASFQRRAFGPQWFNPERARLQCPQYYRWKYSPPAGAANLATIRCNGELAATAAAVPVVLASGQRRVRAWQVCDIATDPRFRRQGLFARCLEALSVAANGEMMFCMPNSHSQTGLTRAGFAMQDAFGVYLRPIFPRGSDKPEWTEGDTDALEAIGSARSEEELRPHVERSLEFLHWRYRSHPVTSYAWLPADAPDGANGVVIVRHIRVLNLRMGIVMEVWPLSVAGMRAGIDVAYRWAMKTHCLALLASSDVIRSIGHWHLRWRISQRSVLATHFDKSAQHAIPASLLVQIGDWDAL